MDQRLLQLKSDYERTVTDALLVMLASGIALPESDLEWALRRIPLSGVLANGATYRKHGYGCSVSNDGVEVDFDFDTSGEVKAPDTFRLVGFCGERFQQYGFASIAELEQAVASGG